MFEGVRSCILTYSLLILGKVLCRLRDLTPSSTSTLLHFCCCQYSVVPTLRTASKRRADPVFCGLSPCLITIPRWLPHLSNDPTGKPCDHDKPPAPTALPKAYPLYVGPSRLPLPPTILLPSFTYPAARPGPKGRAAPVYYTEEEEEEARRDAHPLRIRTTSEGSVQGETTVRIHRMIVRGNDDSRGW